MAALKRLSRGLFLNGIRKDAKTSVIINCAGCRSLSYTSKEYDEKQDPAPLFFNKEVQSLLNSLTRVDLNKVFKKRKLGDKKLEEPTYKFMTDEELQAAIIEAKSKAEEMLQMPPVVKVRKPVDKIISQDPALKGLDSSKFIFTDISFGLRDSERLIVIRDTDGTLKEVDWATKDRMCQVYFPKPSRQLKIPNMFNEDRLEDLLNRKEYEFVLDRACCQFEPNSAEYQKVTSITYQHINENNAFELIRSTRHFGPFSFFLVWNKSIDNLLLDLIETAHINEVKDLIVLYGIVHKVKFESNGELPILEEYIKKYANKKAPLELALQAYKDMEKRRTELENQIKVAHGFS